MLVQIDFLNLMHKKKEKEKRKLSKQKKHEKKYKLINNINANAAYIKRTIASLSLNIVRSIDTCPCRIYIAPPAVALNPSKVDSLIVTVPPVM